MSGQAMLFDDADICASPRLATVPSGNAVATNDSAYAALRYDVFRLDLGDIGLELRDELVRHPWLTIGEALANVMASAKFFDEDAVANAFEEGREKGEEDGVHAGRADLCDDVTDILDKIDPEESDNAVLHDALKAIERTVA